MRKHVCCLYLPSFTSRFEHDSSCVSGIPSCEQHDAASLFTGALSWSWFFFSLHSLQYLLFVSSIISPLFGRDGTWLQILCACPWELQKLTAFFIDLHSKYFFWALPNSFVIYCFLLLLFFILDTNPKSKAQLTIPLLWYAVSSFWGYFHSAEVLKLFAVPSASSW